MGSFPSTSAQIYKSHSNDSAIASETSSTLFTPSQSHSHGNHNGQEYDSAEECPPCPEVPAVLDISLQLPSSQFQDQSVGLVQTEDHIMRFHSRPGSLKAFPSDGVTGHDRKNVNIVSMFESLGARERLELAQQLVINFYGIRSTAWNEARLEDSNDIAVIRLGDESHPTEEWVIYIVHTVDASHIAIAGTSQASDTVNNVIERRNRILWKLTLLLLELAYMRPISDIKVEGSTVRDKVSNLISGRKGRLGDQLTDPYLQAVKLCWEHSVRIRQQKDDNKLEDSLDEDMMEVIKHIENAMRNYS